MKARCRVAVRQGDGSFIGSEMPAAAGHGRRLPAAASWRAHRIERDGRPVWLDAASSCMAVAGCSPPPGLYRAVSASFR